MSKQIDIGRVLANLPLFQQLSDGEIANLATGTREIRLEKGRILFQKGCALDGFYITVYGQIKLAFSSLQGHEKVVSIVGPGQSFGEAVMFMEKPCPVMAQALENSRLLYIAKQGIFAAIDHDSAFAHRLLAGLSMRLHSLIQDVENYSLRSSTQRVIGFLLQLAGMPTSGPVEFALPASKHVIASRLNLTPETLSRILHSLSESGLIAVKGRRIVALDVARLSRFDDSPPPPCAKGSRAVR
ncbi:MAG TPA: Crp/Fnr family transcriptional regulator [Candidatus Competibacter sp.]|nr:Crp/Fnr family transcriptional regulator [Candidatus Competibacter sp.]HRE55035.1 Crp/Fnr family transcriptional regulator [Candidatus Competibacter sp.]